ncbi:alanine--tRNA ligase [Ruminococcaceae bacterium OttesenSCG-928-L11]|nr:alanine--tRNA ligase [Ruminococcaceae bacterium OttesenSCG-928-L11]
MEWTGLNELRERYLSFFESKGHVRLESAPLVPRDDASLLLINSGMAPLKKYFLGLETVPGNRATSCQKCIRTPDIERVGKTSRHGTFFEMLGNFSFGDYFKDEATKWAWEFLTEELKIPADRLWVSIYEEDDDAFDIWTTKRGLPADRIVRLGREDNFWEIGSGPCGPCSEIYFDRGPEYSCGSPDCAVGCDCDRYVEIWNLVFTQFNSDGQGNYTPLEKGNIDTGMGLERLACVMQGVDNLFEVDTVQSVIKHVAEIAGVTYKQDEKIDISLRVVADHIRSTVFMVGDGVVPQNEGRGYVLRRLLRRAARHGKLLGIKEEFLYKVCDTVIDANVKSYPALTENADYIRKVIQVEEERFSRTIEQGMTMLTHLMDEITKQQIVQGRPSIPGEEVFKLYDTFGFPLDLTMEIAADKGFAVDEEGFLKFMHKQREQARKAREEQGEVAWEADVLGELKFEDVFVGYSKLQVQTQVVALVKDRELVEEICEGDEATVFLKETPFYAESGGQVGDTGYIGVGKSVFKVTDCRKSPTGHIMHIGKMISGFIPVGDNAVASVDKHRRHSIMRNHTAAHLLQAALRKVLGEHVHQAGSFVSDEVCRFDFTHFSGMTPEQLLEAEKLVNDMILSAMPVETMEMPMEDAKKLGAMALFGDKYGDIVRVCKIEDASMELCGGTHAGNTAQLGLFRILSESSVAAGVRRIEAVTGRGVLDLMKAQEASLETLCGILKVNHPTELEAKATALTGQMKALQKELDALNKKQMESQLSSMDDAMEACGPVRILTANLGEITVDNLKASADDMKDKYADIVGVFAGTSGEKGSLLVFAGKDAVKAGIHAGKLVKEIAAIAGGGGGGRPDNAMGGATQLDKLNDALASARGYIEAQLGL